MKFYAVIDTNVIIAALLSKKEDTATVKILKELAGGSIVPLYQEDILSEYQEVLQRDKFPIASETATAIMRIILQFGQRVIPVPSEELFPDMDDRIFYEAALAKQTDNAYLVTGNKRHYPKQPFVVTPSEMMNIIEARRPSKEAVIHQYSLNRKSLK